MAASITQLNSLLRHLNANDVLTANGKAAINLFFSDVRKYITNSGSTAIAGIDTALSPRQLARLQAVGQPGGESGADSFEPTIRSLVAVPTGGKNNDWIPTVSASAIGCRPAYKNSLFATPSPPYKPSDPIAAKIVEWPYAGDLKAHEKARAVLIALADDLAKALKLPVDANSKAEADRLLTTISTLLIDLP